MDYSENVLGDQLSRKSEHPFETFLTATALYLREKTGSFKNVGAIKNEVSEILTFMKRIKVSFHFRIIFCMKLILYVFYNLAS